MSEFETKLLSVVQDICDQLCSIAASLESIDEAHWEYEDEEGTPDVQ